ncbi:hypothetical protein PAV_6c00060 [Paenibacillus alvei DSM 29]|nr:hypothetical protein PAV_6c00060 [Paenibacillus alvei DSM 29]
MAMNLGADDYMQKPFHIEVLFAKVQAVLRRTYAYGEETVDLIEWNGASDVFPLCKRDEELNWILFGRIVPFLIT